jgi:hypothetical protein
VFQNQLNVSVQKCEIHDVKYSAHFNLISVTIPTLWFCDVYVVTIVHRNETTGVKCQFALLVCTELLQTKSIFSGGHTKFHKCPSIG